MPSLILVPTPLQASRARIRLCDAQDGLLFGPEVTTPAALAAAVLAASGDRRALLPPLAERLLAVEAGRDSGGAFAGATPAGGLGAALARALGELRRGEVTPRAAREAAGGLAPAAAARLLALAGALEALEGRLAALGHLDRPAALSAAAEAVRRGAPVVEARELDLLVVDGFAALTPAEWALVAALASRARRTRLHLPFLPERPDLCAFAEPLLRRAEGLHELAARREVELVLPRLDGGDRAPGVAALLRALGGGPAGRAEEGEVLVRAGAGEEGEVQLAARTAVALVERGIDPGDLVLIAPAPSRVASRLAAAFAAQGVPFAAGHGTPLADAPPVRAVLGALAAAAGGLSRRGVERLAGSSFLSPGLEAGRLAHLLDRAGAVEGRLRPEEALRRRAGALDPQTAARERHQLLGAADGLARLARSLRPLAGEATARQQAARLTAFVDGAGLRRRAERGPRLEAVGDLAALARLEEVAEGLAGALALAGRETERLSPARWHELLGLALEEATLPAADEPVAGAVTLHGLASAPGLSARGALVLGCARGAFPPAPAAEPLLREPERQAVNDRLRRAALATGAARRAEGLLRATSALAAGREVVAILWPAAGPAGGGPLAPFVGEALAAIGLSVPGPAGDPALGEARSPAEALRAVARLGAARGAGLAALRGTGLERRAASAQERGAIEAERRAAVRDRRASPHAGLAEGAALEALLARLPVAWSPSTLETHATCPFRWLLGVGVGLRDPEVAELDIDVRDEGSLLHAVLERFVAERVAAGAWPPSSGEADVEAARAVAQRLFARFEGQGRVGDPAVWAARRGAVLARLARVVAGEARDHGGLMPLALEQSFGGAAGDPPLALEAEGERVLLQGRLDRVDGGPDQLLVLDYKNSRSPARYEDLLAPEAWGVTSFQIPAYMLAAGRRWPGRSVAATFALLRAGTRLEPAALSDGDLRPPSGPDEPVTGPFAQAAVRAVRAIRAGTLPVVSRDCAHCPFGAVCRFEGQTAGPEAAS